MTYEQRFDKALQALNRPKAARPSGPIEIETSVTVKIKQSLYCGGGWKRLRADLMRLGDGEYEVTVRKIAGGDA